MTSAGEIGEIERISQSISNVEFIWRIKNFSNRMSRIIGYHHKSPTFFFGREEAYQGTIDIYVGGYDRQNADFVGIYLSFSDITGEYEDEVTKCTVEISLLAKGGEKQFTRKATLTDESAYYGPMYIIFKDFVPRRDLRNNSELLHNDELKLACTIWIGEPSISDEITELHCTQETSQKILKKVWEDKQFCDFKLIVGEKEFCVHRAILAAASLVFRAMFESNMCEANKGKVHIEDVKVEIIETILNFIYTGNLYVNADLANVLVVAERYQLDSLKPLCENVLIKRLSVDNVYETLLLADQNNAATLQKHAIEFFLNSSKKLFTTPDNFRASISTFPVSLQTEIICTFMAK